MGSLNLLMPDLRQQGIVTKIRKLKTGKTVGGIPFTRGPLAHLLRNRFYIGEVVFKGETFPGEQSPIIDRDLFEAVQARLSQQATNHKTARMNSGALLTGRSFDDRGNRMTPTYAKKKGVKYRYYISTALVQGQARQVGTVSRIPASDIETRIAAAIRTHLGQPASSEDSDLIRDHLVRVEVRADRLIIELTSTKAASPKRKPSLERIEVPWLKMPMTRRREVLVPESAMQQTARPIRSETRSLLIASIARGRRWLDELITDPEATIKGIATREGCSVRRVNMTISLAFLAPDLVKAAIEVRLPHGMGVARLCDLPPEWSRQYRVLGLPSP